jgi:hypothetical protein
MKTLEIDPPNVEIPLADEVKGYITQRRRMEYAANTLDSMPDYGVKDNRNVKYNENKYETTPHELLIAEAAGRELPVDTVRDILSTPARVREAQRLIADFDHRVVESAVSLRNYVTNRLIIESDNESAKIRIQALTLLGKITDVGLFTEKSEVKVLNRTSEELEAQLHAKLRKYITPDNVEEAVVRKVSIMEELEEIEKADDDNLDDKPMTLYQKAKKVFIRD